MEVPLFVMALDKSEWLLFFCHYLGTTTGLEFKCDWVLLCALYITQDLRLYVPFEGQSNNGSKSVFQDRNSNPHPADQNHQSLRAPNRLATTCPVPVEIYIAYTEVLCTKEKMLALTRTECQKWIYIVNNLLHSSTLTVLVDEAWCSNAWANL